MNHEEFQDRIAAYFAGGLPDEERADFETHRAECLNCAREFAQSEHMEKSMSQLFAAVSPSANFEDRLIGRLRLPGPRLRIHPIVRRSAIAAAAAIVLGGFGYLGTQQMQSGGFGINRFRVASNTQEMGRAQRALSVSEAPSSNAEKWEFGGGSKTSLDFSTYGTSANANNKDEAGKNAVYGDGRVEFQTSPFTGVQRDSIFPRQRFNDIALNRTAAINSDNSILLPADEDGNGIANGKHAEIQEQTRELTETERVRLKASAGQLSLNGNNAYRGEGVIIGSGVVTGTSVVGNKSQIGPTAQTAGEAANNFYFKPTQTIALGTTPPAPGAVAAPGFVAQQIDKAPAQHVFFDGPAKNKEEASKSNATKIALPTLAEATTGGDQNAPVEPNAAKQADQPRGDTPAEPQHVATTQDTVHKVIRNGDIEFEVDSFDSATVTITRIALEEQGFIATTNSEKLPNGKVKGVIVVRIPPDHLDTLVLKLRALGDLKRQNLTAQDVTKQYTDTASELRAARAMEERLLGIIKNSQGAIKDLLAAEKELATWREKIEKLEGEIRYYDNLVSLSTLNISLFERDIRKADVLKETENVDMGVETDDVEAQRAAAIKAIDDAKGRIVESELKKLDAGQLAAKVVAEIPPDAAGPAIDRLKQLGKIARLEIHRAQTSNNDQPAAPGTKVERGDTHLVLSLYNLANVAPRQTDNLNLAATDVEQAYNAIVERVGKSDGRVVTSNLNRQTDQQTSGVIQFEVRSADASGVLADMRNTGEVTRLTVAENPDTNNVTTAKRGFNVTIVSLASMLPREVNNRSIASADVDKSYQAIIESLRKASARIIISRIEDAGKGQHNGYIDFEIARPQIDAIEKALASAGETYNRSVNAAADADNVTDSKVQYKLAVSPANLLPARQSDALAVEVTDVDTAAQSFQSAAIGASGRVIDSNFSKDEHGQSARIVVEVPYAIATQIVSQAKQLGTVRGSQQATNQQAPSGEFARARIELTLASGDVLVAPEHGVMATLRNGLSTSFAGLMWSLELIVIGLCLVGPWVVLLWLGVKLWKRGRRKPVASVA